MSKDRSEQWLLSGDCSICRRKNYCSKPCTRCKREAQAEIKRLVADCVNKATGGVLSEYIDRTIKYM